MQNGNTKVTKSIFGGVLACLNNPRHGTSPNLPSVSNMFSWLHWEILVLKNPSRSAGKGVCLVALMAAAVLQRARAWQAQQLLPHHFPDTWEDLETGSHSKVPRNYTIAGKGTILDGSTF